MAAYLVKIAHSPTIKYTRVYLLHKYYLQHQNQECFLTRLEYIFQNNKTAFQ